MSLSNHMSKINKNDAPMPKDINSAPTLTANVNGVTVPRLQTIKKQNIQPTEKIPETEEIKKIKDEIRATVVSAMVTIGEATEDFFIQEKISQEVAEQTNGLMNRREQRQLEKEIFDSIIKLGPLQDLMEDSNISDILVNQDGRQVFVDRNGVLYLSDVVIEREECKRLVDRIAGRAGRHVDESHPALDCTLKDGSRVNITIPPMSIDGITISIRKFPDIPLTIQDLVKSHALSKQMARFLQIAVEGRCSAIISGGTGSGKTTLLNALSNFIPNNERIITIEDAAELRIRKPNLVRLESRDANSEGKGEITIRDCVIDTLRMRPDRIIVGECRSNEIVDMLQAMNTGHDGSLTTIHSNSIHDCLIRIETLFLMSGIEMPMQAVRRQIVSAIDIIIQIERTKNGSRYISEIAEIVGMEKDTISTNTIYKYEKGRHVASGINPRTIISHVERNGLTMDNALFEPPRGQ